LAFSSIDRTAEVESSQYEVTVASTDLCRYYEKHPDTFLQRKECWTCLYGNFGIESSKASETGRCNYKLKRPNRMEG
jgi:hypothetical protein